MCCHSICPCGIRCCVSALLFSLPPASTSCPHPLFSSLPPTPPFPGTTDSGIWHRFVIVSGSRQMETSIGSNNLWGVTFGSPSPHFLCSASPRGCHGGLDRWSRKRKGELSAIRTARCQVCLCASSVGSRLEVMGRMSTHTWVTHRC